MIKMWVDIINLKKSDNKQFLIAYFDYFGQTKSVIITKKVLQFLKISNFDNVKEMFVIKTFDKHHNPIYLVRKVREREEE